MIPASLRVAAAFIARTLNRADQHRARRSGMPMARLATPLAFILAIGGCAGPAGTPGAVGVSGGVYTDLRMDMACNTVPIPVELVGVTLSFTDEAGTVVGTATTGVPTVSELPVGPGTETWAHGGCRVFAGYQVSLPPRERYSVDFEPRDVARPVGAGYFQGVELLEPQSISAEELATNGYAWNFEAPPAYVVH